MTRLRWGGSQEAMRQHAEALKSRPPKRKLKKKRHPRHEYTPGAAYNWAYLIPAGTPVEVRPTGAVDWRQHRTAREVVCRSYADKGDDCFVFVSEGWEIRVLFKRIRRRWVEDRENGGALPARG